MPKRGTVTRAVVPLRERELAGKVRQDWGRHRNLMRFLADYFPTEWEEIQHCSLDYKAMEETADPGWYKLVPLRACHRIPYCITCTRREAQRRIRNAFDQFARCTPHGRRPRFVHVVQTAPIYDDGTGWGVAASQDVKAFGGVVWDALTDLYGAGLGAVMSYQDFGEQAFAKRHPHMDLTLNGYMLQDGQPVLTPRIDLQGNGRAKWDETVVHHARRLDATAHRGSAWIGSAVEGVRAYYGQLKYQMREMVDFRKLDYSRDKGRIWWLSYKDGQRTMFTPDQFLDGLIEYQVRLQTWTHSTQLHRAYGIMAKRSIGKTEALVGGAPLPHDDSCPCGECGDWHRVFLEDTYDNEWAPPLRPD